MTNMKAGSYVTCALLMLSVPIAAYGQEGRVSSDLAASVQKLLKQHEAWSTGISSPGASVRVKEIGRDGSVVRYNFYVSGIPNDRVYSVVSWPVNQTQPATIMEGVSLGKAGIVSCTGRLKGECVDPSGDKDGAVDFAFDSLSGEPNRLALIAGDERAAVIVVPNPITASDRGCTLSVVRLTPHFEVAFFTGTGYSPGAGVVFRRDSYGEHHKVEAIADPEGNIHFALLPFASGHQHGTTAIGTAGAGCSPSLRFDWGQ